MAMARFLRAYEVHPFNAMALNHLASHCVGGRLEAVEALRAGGGGVHGAPAPAQRELLQPRARRARARQVGHCGSLCFKQSFMGSCLLRHGLAGCIMNPGPPLGEDP